MHKHNFNSTYFAWTRLKLVEVTTEKIATLSIMLLAI